MEMVDFTVLACTPCASVYKFCSPAGATGLSIGLLGLRRSQYGSFQSSKGV